MPYINANLGGVGQYQRLRGKVDEGYTFRDLKLLEAKFKTKDNGV